VLAEVTTRLRAELAAAGFGVEELVLEAGADVQERVAAAGLAVTPDATLAVAGEDGAAGVDLWLSDPRTHDSVFQHVDMPAVARQRAPSALAVRAVELLRASLLGEAPRETPAPTPPKPPPEKPDDAGARGGETSGRPTLSGELGAGMLYGARGVAPAFAPLLRFALGTKTWAARLNVLAPAFGGEVAAAGGSAALREELASLDATVTLPAEGPLAFVGFAGAGGYHWHVSGEPAAPNVGHDAERWGATVDVGAGMMFRFGTRFGLILDAQALWFAPPLAVRIAGVEAGRSGEPTLCASLGLWVTL
jgi:hypothetical protein